MKRDDLPDLQAFVAVADARSFTRAAAVLETSQSALSHTLSRLEARLGVRLLTRTTRSVSLTEAGERLMATLKPALSDIEAGLQSLTTLRDQPSGTIRITTSEFAARAYLWPAIAPFVRRYPDVKIELSVDGAFLDIVEHRFDAGVRLGEAVAKDMIAVRIGPDLRMVVVGSPEYLRTAGRPVTPHDLTRFDCIRYRLATHGALYQWEFSHGGRDLNVKVDGALILNSTALILDAAVAGHGLAFVLEDVARPYLADGRLHAVLLDWCEPFTGAHLYYPNRRQPTPAFALLVDALRYRPPTKRRQRATRA